jgi:hypothetical protein
MPSPEWGRFILVPATQERTAAFWINGLQYTVRRDIEGVYYFRRGAGDEWTRGIPPGTHQSELDGTFREFDRKASK